MKIINYILFLLLQLFLSISIFATTNTASVSGNWNNTATWGGSSIPTATDDIVINSGVTVTLVADYTTSASVTLNGTAIFEMNGNNLTVGSLAATGSSVINNGGALANFTVGSLNTNTSFSGALNGSITLLKVGTGTLTLSGNSLYTGNTSISGGSILVSNNNSLGNSPNIYLNVGASSLMLQGVKVSGKTAYINTNTGANYGTIQAYNSDSEWNGPVVLDINDSRIGSNNAVLTISGIISNSNNNKLVISSNSTIVYAAANSYIGTTRLFRGNLKITGDNYIPSSTILEMGLAGSGNNSSLDLNGYNQTLSGYKSNADVSSCIVQNNGGSPSTLTINNSNAYTFSGVIQDGTNTISLTKLGTATLTLSGINTYSGTTIISAGTLQLGASGVIPDVSVVTVTGILDLNTFSETVGSITGAGTIDNVLGAGTPTLTCNGNGNSTTFSGTIQNTSGSVSIIKNGNGTLTLSGANTYTGTTTINAGTLILQNTYSSPSYSIASGAVLELNRTVYTDYTTSTTFCGAGTLRKTGSGQVLWGLSAGTFALSAGSLIDIQAGIMSGSSSGNEVWTNNYSGLTVASGATFQGVEGSVKVDALNGAGTVTSGWLGTGSITIGINNGSGTFSGVIGDFDFSSGHTGSIIKVGTGTQTLSGANTFTRGVTLNAGQLNINSTTALGTGTFTIANNGTSIDNTSGGSITLSTNNVQTWNGDFTYIGTKPLNLGTGAVAMGTTLRTVTTTASTLTVGGTISGTGGLTKAGAGTMTLGGISFSNWTGPTTISAGIFNLGTQAGGDYYASTAWTIYSGATLFQSSTNVISNSAIVTVNNGGIWDLNGKSECVGYIAGSGSISNTGGLFQLDLPATGTGSEFSGVISGSAQLKIRGNITAGKQILSGLNTYTGITSILKGTLSINSIQNVSGGASAIGAPTTIANGTILLGSTTTTGILEYTGTGNITDRVIDLSGTTGGGTITQSGTDLLKFTSAFTATGIGVKTLTLQGSSTGTGEIAGSIVDGSGTTIVTKLGTGTWTLSGANTYTGLTTINGGIVKLGSSTALGSIAAGTVVNDGYALDLNGQTYINAEALTIVGTGISSGGCVFNSNTAAATFPGAISLANASTIKADNQITLSGTISNNQHFTKTGTNTLVFSNNTVTVNNLAISDGTLDGASSTVNVYGNFTSNGIFIPNTNGIVLLGSSIQTIPAVSFNNLTINNAAGANLAGNISVAGILTLTNGILTTGAYSINLGTSGSIVEATPSITAPTSYVIGMVKATRTLVQNTNNTFGGIGVELTEANINNNATLVVRTTGTGCFGNGKTGITRYFTINPTTDIGLNGTMVFHYFDNEITGHSESNLKIFKSTDSRIHWTMQNSTNDVVNNKLTLSGISSFSDWTASDGLNNSLPIELKSFNVKKYSEKVDLLWITASETNNDFFTLEHSSNGNDWLSIYICNGVGSSTKEHHYSYTDYNPSTGINYYRLKQTDFDGNFTYSNIKTVLFTNDSISMQIYPIPAKAEQITIFVSCFKTGPAKIAVFDLLGQQICNGEIELGSSPFKIQLSDICNLIPGTYYVTISNNDMMVRKKIIVE